MPRLFAPLEFTLAFGVLGAVGLAISTLFGEQLRYLRALVALAAFPIAAWSASFARQIVYELRTDGRVSSQMDTCAIALMPIFITVLSFMLVTVAEGYAALGKLRDVKRPRERLSIRTIFVRHQIVVSAIFLFLGISFGSTHWVDWRINQPCL